MRRNLGLLLVFWLLASALIGCGADDIGTVDVVTTRTAAPETTDSTTTSTTAARQAATAPTTSTTTTTTTTGTADPLEDGRVGFGDDGWLFHPGQYEPKCEDIDVATVVTAMRRLTEALVEAGKPVVLVIAPAKGAVYPDKLGPLEAAFESAERLIYRRLLVDCPRIHEVFSDRLVD